MTDLTDQQRSVVDAPIDARQLVLGGAGTGKTHVLVERIRQLIDTEDVAPGSEILVLSFTRAVVRELKARLRLSTGQVRLVRPVTFDSFATRLLHELPGDDPPSWRDAGYDGRIRAATTAITESAQAAEILATYRHVFVDEIQDLVGVRADMVLQLLRHARGFTVLGDPAQAIYDHQLRDDRTGTTSAAFLTSLSSYERLETIVLEENFRSKHGLSDEIGDVGSVLRDPRRDGSAAHGPLVEILNSLDHINSFDDLAFALRGTHESTAVLCRTNAECLRVSQRLFEAGVDHRLQQEATERVLPAWLAELFLGVDRKQWSTSRLGKLVAARRADGVMMPNDESVIRFLTDAVGDDTVDLDKFRTRLQYGALPDHIHDVEDVPIVVSSIHRAKGLEFDRVFFGAPRNGVQEDEAEEYRVLYVAVSRSREDLWSFKAPNVALWHRVDRCDDRWVKWPWGQSWKTLGWEVRPADVETRRPARSDSSGADVLALQRQLSSGLRRGLEVKLALTRVRDSEEPVPFYSVAVDRSVLGETSESFGETLRRRLTWRDGTAKFPPAITNVFLSGVETVVGAVVEGEVEGLGVSGMWLRPRISGLGRVDWYAE